MRHDNRRKNYHRTEVALMEKIKYKDIMNKWSYMQKVDDNEYVHKKTKATDMKMRKSVRGKLFISRFYFTRTLRMEK